MAISTEKNNRARWQNGCGPGVWCSSLPEPLLSCLFTGGSYWLMVELFWVNYNELTTSSLEIIVSKGKYPQMALIQVSELL